jgi:hypothetical protein
VCTVSFARPPVGYRLCILVFVKLFRTMLCRQMDKNYVACIVPAVPVI